MSQQHDPLFERDAQEKAHEDAVTDDTDALTALMQLANVQFLAVTPWNGGYRVSLPIGKNSVSGMTERLGKASKDYSYRHGRDNDGEYLYVRRRK